MRAILENKRLGNTNIKFELGVDEIKNDIQNNRLRRFGKVLRESEERISKKILHEKMVGKRPKGRLRSKWMDSIRKDVDMK